MLRWLFLILFMGCSQFKGVSPKAPSLSAEIDEDPLLLEDVDENPKDPLLEGFLPDLKKTKHKIKANSSVYENLASLGMKPVEILDLVKATKSVHNLGRMPSGTPFTSETDRKNRVRRLVFRLSETQRLRVWKHHSRWKAKTVLLPTKTRVVHFAGDVLGNLWSSAMQAGVPPSLFIRFADIFSWEVDFSREIRSGDSWMFSAERVFVEGEPIGWGKILKARYKNQGRNYTAFYFDNPKTGVAGYFDETGRSLRKMFLKSPLKFGRVTSGFSLRRFHPIKKVYRPHYGVDYGAPRGTPVHTIAGGRVLKIGRFGSAGKMITIAHPGRYRTNYLHLSRFASNLRVGDRVQQGQTIGYVGSTGSATGPHLHFELFQRGKYRDPLKLEMPPSKALAKDNLEDFKKYIKTL